HWRQHPHRQKEPRPAGDPVLPVWCDPAARDKKMNMWVMQQVLSPRMSHTEEADLRSQMLRIGGDPAQRLRRRTEQDIVDHGLVLERDGGDQIRHGEHDVEVGHIEQFCLTVFEPLGACETLALRTIPVSTRIVGHALMAAIAALLDVTAKGSGAAPLDRSHGVPPRCGQRRAMPITESRAEVAEHIRHLQPRVAHGRALRRARGPARPVSSLATRPVDWRWRRPCWWRCVDTLTW